MSGALALGNDLGESLVPPRLDRLPWSNFHWRVVIALGVSWILDGLQVTLFGSLAGAIHQSPTFGLLGLRETEIGAVASFYVAGAVSGALGFGWLADRLGRRQLFFVTLIVYMVASIATGFAWDFWSFAIFRALTGAGIGGDVPRRSTPSSRNWSQPASEVRQISRSMAPFGQARYSARWCRSWCWTRPS